MTGRINRLNRLNSSGFIISDSGLRIPFKSSELLAYDLAHIAVGQLVTFDLKSGRRCEATNICRLQTHTSLATKGRERHFESQTRYLGFEQAGNIRSYRFDLTSPGEEMHTIVFQIDLKLFITHHLLVQDGPTLCRHIFLTRPLEFNASGTRLCEFVLRSEDIAAYQASLPRARERKHRLQKPSALGVVSA